MTILVENHHSFLIIEHDPMLYEDASEMVEYLAQALRQTSREATILLYSPALDPHLQKMTEQADRLSASTRPSKLLKEAGRRTRRKFQNHKPSGGILMIFGNERLGSQISVCKHQGSRTGNWLCGREDGL